MYRHDCVQDFRWLAVPTPPLQIKQDKYDKFISPDEGLFERNM